VIAVRSASGIHCMILRGLADLIEAGEPQCWSTSYAPVPGQPTTVSISIEGEAFLAAKVAVSQRAYAKDTDYLVRVEYREPTARRSYPRRR